MTTNNPPKKALVNAGKHRNFNAKALHSIDAIRAVSHFMPAVSADAYNLSRYLATWWNGSSANGVVNPDERRIQRSLQMTPERHRNAAYELEAVGWWKASQDGTGKLLTYTPIFLERAMDNRKQLKGMRSSLNHSKMDSRYTLVDDPLAKALMGWASERIEPVFNDLGYQHFIRTEQVKKVHAVRNGNLSAKLCHSVMFEHELLTSKNPDTWALLAGMDPLPRHITEAPFSLTFTTSDFNRHVRGDMDLNRINDAVTAINAGMWWEADFVPDDDPFAPLNSPLGRFTLTPTYRLHSMVWDIDNHSGGKALSAWEAKHGFGRTSTRQDLPPLGYHYIYCLRSQKGGERLIVGQTTQALDTRLHQHARQATNGDANERVLAILRDPDDDLVIEHLATVFHSEVARMEMEAAHEMLRLGHPLLNKVLTVAENRRTIKLDSRFGRNLHYGEEERLLAECLRKHDGRKVLVTNKLPLVGGSVAA